MRGGGEKRKTDTTMTKEGQVLTRGCKKIKTPEFMKNGIYT